MSAYPEVMSLLKRCESHSVLYETQECPICVIGEPKIELPAALKEEPQRQGRFALWVSLGCLGLGLLSAWILLR